MSRFPYMNLPFPFYRSYPRSPANLYNFTNPPIPPSIATPIRDPSSKGNIDFSRTNNSNFDSTDGTDCFDHKQLNRRQNFKFFNDDLNHNNKSNKNNDDFLFDLFGLKIYNDDILLVSLIYFLYSEGVKDDGLFLVLVLLLLS